MAYEHYRSLYGYLLHLYPRSYYERLGEGMAQTFNDLMRERAHEGRGLFGLALWMYVETFVSIIKENTLTMITQLRTLYFVAACLALLIIPFSAMQFHYGGWDWSGSDFAIAAVLLTGFGFALAAATDRRIALSKRVIGFGALGLLVLLYVHLAVGIVDTWPLAGS